MTIQTIRASKFAQRTFFIAGVYGILALLPLYLLETPLAPLGAVDLERPEFLYGFAGVAIAWQLAFIVISRDVRRYRALIPVAIVEKLSFGISAPVLYSQGRLGGDMLAGGLIDLVLATLFFIAFRRTAVQEPSDDAK